MALPITAIPKWAAAKGEEHILFIGYLIRQHIGLGHCEIEGQLDEAEVICWTSNLARNFRAGS